MNKEPLPAGIWIVGIIGCLIGGWNGLGGSIASLIALTFTPSSDPDARTLIEMPAMKIFLPLTAAWGILILSSSIGLLRRNEWGRKGLLIAAVLTLVGFIGFVAFIIFISGANIIESLIGGVMGLIFVGTPAILVFWYLTRDEIKTLYTANRVAPTNR
jgi:hypothetical protein